MKFRWTLQPVLSYGLFLSFHLSGFPQKKIEVVVAALMLWLSGLHQSSLGAT